MAIVNPSIVNDQVDLFGELVTITVKSDQTYSNYGDETSVETSISGIKAVYNVYAKPSVSDTEGKFQEGNISFFFKSDQSGLVNGTLITRANGDVYKVKDPRDHSLAGVNMVNEVLVKKA